ncbi:MAG: SwmB domain-containing protein, partial [Acidobacteriota bacterium]|nr:SwmB domain-containing protein [Acidobacteriota bacterium]
MSNSNHWTWLSNLLAGVLCAARRLPPEIMAVRQRMRIGASRRGARFPVFGFRAGIRICSGSLRRVVSNSTLAVAFLASLLAFGFGRSHFAQFLLNSAPAAKPAGADVGGPPAPNRDAGGRAGGGAIRSGLEVSGGPGPVEFGLEERPRDGEDSRPRVRGFEISSDPGADGTYAAADRIRVTATFSRPVQVTGSPEIELRVGTEAKPASYHSGSGSSELVFAYRVAAGDEDADGVSIEAGNLRLHEGEIRDLSGNAASTDHEGLEADPGHRVDGVGPVLLEEEAELDGNQLTLPFAEALDMRSTPEADDFRVTVAGRSREVSKVAVEGSTVRLTLLAPAEEGQAAAVSYQVEAEPPGEDIRDRAGNPAEEFTDRTVTNRTRAGLSARTVRQVQAILQAKQRRTPAQRKLDSQLLQEWHKARGRPGADRMVTVDLRVEATPEVLERIRELGGKVLSSVERYRAIRAELPLSEVEALAAHEAVRSMRTADKAITHDRRRKPFPEVLVDVPEVGSRTTQGDVAHQANTARTTHGVDGTGIGIGVLSDGVDSLAARQATGDLPAQVTVLAGQEGAGDEGTAILEILHDLAPGADLYFATGFRGMSSFAESIEALCRAGADVIVDDIKYLVEAPFQDDIIARGVNAAVDNGCFYFSSAGNGGKKNNGTAGVWEGDFAAGSPLVLNGVTVGTQHDFGGGVTQNRITGDSRAGYLLWWADPLEGSANDYDLFLVDENGDVVASSTRVQDGTQHPYELIDSEDDNHAGDRLVVVKTSGAADRYLRLDTWEGRLAVSTAGKIYGHAAAENAIAVAAVTVQNAGGAGGVFDGTEPVRGTSSDGPRRIFFEPDGAAITAGNFSSSGGKLLQKPEMAAATCVRTSTPGFWIFCGTSSAAPHAAAIGALALEGAGGPNNLTRAQLLAAMTGSALDIEASGVDRDSGAGIVMAPGSVDAVDVVAADRNQAPKVETELDDRTFALGASAVTLDLADTFEDPDTDALTLSALSSDSDRAFLSLAGSMLTLTPGAPGAATVTVRATDPGGLSAVDSFSVSVTAGTRDYDRDNDFLIEVSTLAQLDAIRYDLDGDGAADVPSDWPSYFAAFTQATPNMGCRSGCIGYELAADLDFDTDGSGGANDGDTYWNGGDGWEPIGGGPFRALFIGNGRTIANLFIDRSAEDEVGLFGEVGVGGLIRDMALVGVDVTGRDYVGGLFGKGAGRTVVDSYVTGSVSGEDVVGGLAGSLMTASNSYAAVRVTATGDAVGRRRRAPPPKPKTKNNPPGAGG